MVVPTFGEKEGAQVTVGGHQNVALCQLRPKEGLAMLTANELRILRTNLKRYEGWTNYMYLDSRGYVTIGVGHLIPNASDAVQIPFVVPSSGQRASSQQIGQAYNNLSSLPSGNYTARYYERFTQLRVKNVWVARMLDRQLKLFYGELCRLYPGFQLFPESAKIALFDMIFNLGATKLRMLFPKFNQAIQQRDWQVAASESHRLPPVSVARNQYVHDLLIKAALASTVHSGAKGGVP